MMKFVTLEPATQIVTEGLHVCVSMEISFHLIYNCKNIATVKI